MPKLPPSLNCASACNLRRVALIAIAPYNFALPGFRARQESFFNEIPLRRRCRGHVRLRPGLRPDTCAAADSRR
ncbi:hypothetical protein BRL76_05345, partial [Xanthomonas oryzae pv. oryzae]